MINFTEKLVMCKIPDRKISLYKGLDESNQWTVLKHYYKLTKKDYKIRKREIKCMKSLQDHPRVVKILEYEETREFIEGHKEYEIKILMEFLGDKNLAKHLEEIASEVLTIDEEWLRNEMIELIKLFSLMQERNICHRDIRPENIMVCNGTLKIIDFSEGKFNCNGLNPSFRGHISYLSPEMRKRFLDKEFTFDEYKSDVWSLGLVFLKIATFSSLSFDYGINAQQEVDKTVFSITNEWIRNTINWMLQVDVNSRKNFIELREMVTYRIINFNYMDRLTISTPTGDFVILDTLLKAYESKNYIYSVELLPGKTKAILKSFKIGSKEDLKRFENEAKILSSISHKRVVKYLRSFKYTDPTEGISCFAIAMEYCEGGNLEGMLEQMKKIKQKFSAMMLLDQIFELIEVLAYLQSRNIMHRDIKPDNIFVVNQNELKLADFDLGKESIEDYLHTFQGSPEYLSPILFESLSKIIQFGSARVNHNVYKSDVYSLGLIFFYMATMNKPPKIGKNRPPVMLAMVQKIENMYVKKILEKMLAIEEVNRSDFIELKYYIQNIKNMTICALCLKYMSQTECACKKCCYGFHIDCISNKKKCFTCKSELVCPKCTDNYILTAEKCSHELCMKCHDNYTCPYKVEIINDLENFTLNPPLLSYCVKCLNEIVEIDGVPFCMLCKQQLCDICRFPHSDELQCFFANTDSPIYCLCGNSIYFIRSSLFLDCSQCGSICRVCMKSLTEYSHLQCSHLISPNPK